MEVPLESCGDQRPFAHLSGFPRAAAPGAGRGGSSAGRYEVGYQVSGRGWMLEAVVSRVRNGSAAGTSSTRRGAKSWTG